MAITGWRGNFRPLSALAVDSKREGAMSKKLDAAINALVDAPAELPEHELEGWQRGNRLGLRILCELGRRYPGMCRRPGWFDVSPLERFGGGGECCAPGRAQDAPATGKVWATRQRVPSS